MIKKDTHSKEMTLSCGFILRWIWTMFFKNFSLARCLIQNVQSARFDLIRFRLWSWSREGGRHLTLCLNPYPLYQSFSLIQLLSLISSTKSTWGGEIQGWKITINASIANFILILFIFDFDLICWNGYLVHVGQIVVTAKLYRIRRTIGRFNVAGGDF